MQFLTLTAILVSAALGSPIAQQYDAPNTPVATPPVATPVGTPGATLFCGQHRYMPSAYVCHNNTTLCPVQNGVALQACGQQCYDPKIYSCSAGALQIGNGTAVATPGVWPPAGATPTGTPVAIPGAQ